MQKCCPSSRILAHIRRAVAGERWEVVEIPILVALGIVWLVRVVGKTGSNQPPAPAVPTRTCPNCHKPVQADWHNCPYCGTALE